MVWFFERGSERLECEVRRRGAGYEVALSASDDSRVQAAATATELLEQFGGVVHGLIHEGWSPRPCDPFMTCRGDRK